MKAKCSVFVATSLDGFIARKDGSLDWLPPPTDENGEDYGFAAFMATVDFVVMGRNTYETVLKMGGEWPYAKTVFVLSSQDIDIPGGLRKKVEVGNFSPAELVKILETRGAKRIYVDGGQTIQRFLNAGLIDDLTISPIPVLIGDGIPLFGPLAADIKLELAKSQTFSGGFVSFTYRVARKTGAGA